MSIEKIGFEILNMDINANKDIIEFIYESSNVEKKIHSRHPLEKICDAMKASYNVQVHMAIERSRREAYVTFEFDETIEKSKIKQVSNRFQHTAEQLLNAKMIMIYEKFQ